MNIPHTYPLFSLHVTHEHFQIHFHHRPIYIIILQSIIISPSFIVYISTFIVLKSLLSTIWTYPNLVVLVRVFNGCFKFIVLSLKINSFDFFNNQFKCLTSTNIHFNTCIFPQFVISNCILLSLSIVDSSFFFTIIHVSWFQGQPCHSTIHWWFKNFVP